MHALHAVCVDLSVNCSNEPCSSLALVSAHCRRSWHRYPVSSSIKTLSLPPSLPPPPPSLLRSPAALMECGYSCPVDDDDGFLSVTARRLDLGMLTFPENPSLESGSD